LTTLITLTNDRPGVVDHKLPRKIHEDHLNFFKDGALITEQAGAQLAAWAKGDEPKKVEPEPTKVEAKTEGTPKTEPEPAKTGKREVTEGDLISTVDKLIERMAGAANVLAVDNILREQTVQKQIQWLYNNRRPLHKKLIDGANAARRALRDKAAAG
jgi:hypothetical protein